MPHPDLPAGVPAPDLLDALAREARALEPDADRRADWDAAVHALADRFLDGYLDEVRVSSTIRYGTGFNPQGPFSDDAFTLALWHFEDAAGSAAFLDASTFGNDLTANASATARAPFSVSGGGQICDGASVPLTVSGGDSFSWSPAAGLDDPFTENPVASPDATTYYTVTATDRNSCENLGIVAVVIREEPYVDKQKLDVALATNMISVGLDIARLGLMVVLNQPKTAAEYIQATSRVGRQLSDNPDTNKPGLVLVLLNPNRPRDRSHFELFPYWHQTFYRHVEATSCTPFASRAIDRGLPGVVVAMARHSEAQLAPPSGAMSADALQRIKGEIAEVLQNRCMATGAADAYHSQLLPTEVRQQVMDLMEAWWKLTQQPEAKLQYWTHEEKGSGAGLLHTPLDTDDLYASDGYKQFSTNWSLRDVEPTVPIRLVNYREEITADDE